MNQIPILFVCTANICRSPMAEGIAVKYLKSKGMDTIFAVRSAGTHVLRKGVKADPRAIQIALENGVDIKKSSSKKRIVENIKKANIKPKILPILYTISISFLKVIF